MILNGQFYRDGRTTVVMHLVSETLRTLIYGPCSAIMSSFSIFAATGISSEYAAAFGHHTPGKLNAYAGFDGLTI